VNLMGLQSKGVPARATIVAVFALMSIGSAARGQQVTQAADSSQKNSVETARQWIPTPSILPVGGKLSILSGDPFAPGTFTLEFAMPDGYTLPPHTNPSTEHVLVKSGALVVGVGRRIDRSKSVVLTAGDTASVPPGIPHWSIARGETHLIITEAMGPYGIAYMSVRDEPGAHAFPNGYSH
jgi:quercetin dioxygenase-like cupin family protein